MSTTAWLESTESTEIVSPPAGSANDLPAAYRHTAMIGNVLRGMSRRLSRANPIGDALPVLAALHAPLQERFEAFFPDLRNFASIERVRLVESPP